MCGRGCIPSVETAILCRWHYHATIPDELISLPFVYGTASQRCSARYPRGVVEWFSVAILQGVMGAPIWRGWCHYDLL